MIHGHQDADSKPVAWHPPAVEGTKKRTGSHFQLIRLHE